VEPFRRPAEVKLVGEGEEDAQFPKLDRLPHREATLHDAFIHLLLIGPPASDRLAA